MFKKNGFTELKISEKNDSRASAHINVTDVRKNLSKVRRIKIHNLSFFVVA